MTCVHRWKLGAFDGLRVPATCKDCGAVRDYPSDPDDQKKWRRWNEQPGLGKGSAL